MQEVSIYNAYQVSPKEETKWFANILNSTYKMECLDKVGPSTMGFRGNLLVISVYRTLCMFILSTRCNPIQLVPSTNLRLEQKMIIFEKNFIKASTRLSTTIII